MFKKIMVNAIEQIHEKNEHQFRNFITSFTAVAALSLAACSSGSSTETESLEPTITQNSDSPVSSVVDTVDTLVDGTIDETSSTTELENEESNNEVDTSSELDTSYWNLSPDKVEILSFLALEHGYPVSADKGDFTEGASYDEILFEASQAFNASRNTHSLLPLANYFGFDSVDDWGQDRSQSIYQIEDSFSDNFYKSVTEKEDGFTQFDRLFDQVFINELYTADGTRSLSGVEMQAYKFDVGLGYSGGGLDDSTVRPSLDESKWSEHFPYSTTQDYGIKLDIAPDGTIKSFSVEYKL